MAPKFNPKKNPEQAKPDPVVSKFLGDDDPEDELQEEQQPKETTKPKARSKKAKVEIVRKEKRSKKFVVAMAPSLHARIKEAAQEAGVSVNDYIHQALDNVTP